MLLQQYLDKYKVTQVAFAEKINMSRDIVARWLRKECYPTRRTANKIVEATGGRVTIADIYR